MPAILSRNVEVDDLTGDNGHLINIPSWIFLFVCPLVVGTRIWSRKRTGGRLGADDYTILASLTFAVATDVLSIWGVSKGYGKHAVTLTPSNRLEAFKSFYLTQITYKLSINLTKSSILFLYLRIFHNVKWFRTIVLTMLIVIASYIVAATAATVFQCLPVRAAFDRDHVIPGKTCIDNGKFWFANAGFSIATDLIILVLPMPLVWALQIPRVQKWALVFVFALGAFVVTTSTLRATTLNTQAKSPDPLYDIASTMWTIIEMSVAIICACLPQIRPLVVKFFPRLMPVSYPYGRGAGKKCSAAGGGDSTRDTARLQQKERNEGIGRGRGRGKGLGRGDSDESLWGVETGRSHLAGRVVDADLPSGDANANKDEGMEMEMEGIRKTVQYSVEYSTPRHGHADEHGHEHGHDSGV